MQIKQIELNPVEATSYWWINTIQKKLQEILVLKMVKEEICFLNSFNNYTDIEWRKLYLELTKYIYSKVDKLSYEEEFEYYHQATPINHHNDINEVLSKVTKKKIPDITLNLTDIESSTIYTNKYGADRVYSVSGIVPLDMFYDSNYVLTGNKVELEIKNLVIKLIESGILNESFESFKNKFCEIYGSLHHDMDQILIEESFIRIFNQLSDQGIIETLNNVKIKKLY